jgi:hypothetical protein
MKWINILHPVMVALAFAVMWWGITHISGCMPVTHGTPINTVPNTVTQVITKTNWVVTISWLAIMGGVLSFINGSTKGIKAIATGLVGMSVWYMQAAYWWVLALVGLIGSLSLLTYTLYIRFRGFREVVESVQLAKMAAEGVKQPLPDVAKGMLHQQSLTTKAMVKKVKAKF